MQEEQDLIVQDQPLKVLQLFPKRQPHKIQINLHTFTKLYENLLCSICNQLLKTPVFLKCSHRYCRQCIQKHIRTSLKKTCIHCRGQMTTKRDLRYDYNTQDFIKIVFKDPKTFNQTLEQLQNPLITTTRSRNQQARRVQLQHQLKMLRQPSQDNEPVLPLRRTKTAQTDKRKKAVSQKKIQSKQQIQPEKDSTALNIKRGSRKVQDKQKELKKPQPSKNTVQPKIEATTEVISIKHGQIQSRGRAKEKVIPLIDLASESEPVEQIRRQQFLVKPEQNVCSISHLQDDSYQVSAPEKKQVAKPAVTTRSLRKRSQTPAAQQQKKPEAMDIESEYIIPQQQKVVEKVSKVDKAVLQAIQHLHKQFGDLYPMKIIQLSPFKFYTDVTIRPNPTNLVIPSLLSGTFKLNMKSDIQFLCELVALWINLPPSAIQLSLQKEGQMVSLDDRKQRLLDVNYKNWNSWAGIELLTLEQQIQNNLGEKQQELPLRRTLFYNISPDNIALQIASK